jgi:hypothetical protein
MVQTLEKEHISITGKCHPLKTAKLETKWTALVQKLSGGCQMEPEKQSKQFKPNPSFKLAR